MFEYVPVVPSVMFEYVPVVPTQRAPPCPWAHITFFLLCLHCQVH